MEPDRHARECGKILTSFVNQKNANPALQILYKNVKKTFGFDVIYDSEKTYENIDEVIANQKRLRKIFKRMLDNEKLFNFDPIEYFLERFNSTNRQFLEITRKDKLVYSLTLEKDSPHDRLISYCLFEFLNSDVAKDSLSTCEECGNFTVFMRAGSYRFCSGKCKNRFHNQRKVKSGKHKRIMAEGRSEGKYQ